MLKKAASVIFGSVPLVGCVATPDYEPWASRE